MSSRGRKSKDHDHERDPLERYDSPSWSVEAIMPHVSLAGHVLDPCAGIGNVLGVASARALPSTRLRGIEIDPARAQIARDLRSLRVVEGDMFSTPWGHVDLLLTNPPFTLAAKLLEHAFRVLHRTATVALLLRVGFLESDERNDMVRAAIPDTHILPSRPDFLATRNTSTRTDSTPYAWLIWGPGRAGRIIVLPREMPGFRKRARLETQALLARARSLGMPLETPAEMLLLPPAQPADLTPPVTHES